MTAALIAKLESASEGSRELDRELMALTYVWEQRHIGATCWDKKASGKRVDDNDDTCCPDAKHLDWVWVDPLTDQWKTTARDGFEFTTSIDAALALAERVIGGHIAMMLLSDVLDANDGDLLSVSDIPRLLCAALLRASAAEGAGHE